MKKIRFYSQSLFGISAEAWKNPKEYIEGLGYEIVDISYEGFADCFVATVSKWPEIKPKIIEYL